MRYAILSALLFGAAVPICKWLGVTWPEVLLAGALYLSCGIGLLAIRYVHPFGESLQRADWKWMLGTIVFGGIAAPIFLLYGLRYTTGLAGSLLVNSEMIFTSLLSLLFFGGKLSKSDFVAIAVLASAACIVSVGSAEAREGSRPLFGALLISIACFGWGLDNNFTEKISHRDPLEVAGIKGLVAGIVNLALGLVMGERPPSDVLSISVAFIIGLLSYGVSIALFVVSLRKIGSARTSALSATAPVTGVLVAWLFLGETPHIWAIVGGLLMVMTILWMACMKTRHRKEVATVHT